MTLKELQAILENLPEGEILVKIEKKGKSYVLPLEVLDIVFGNSSGLLQKNRNQGGEKLLDDAPISIAGTTVVYSEYFDVKGYKYLLVTIVNPTWTTNPTGITMGQQFTPDNGTTAFDVYVGTSKLTITLNKEDTIKQAHFIYQASVANMVLISRYPDVNSNHKIRLVFTPAGTAEAQIMTVSVYGIGV